MKTRTYALFALAIAAVMVSSGAALTVFGANSVGTAGSNDNQSNNGHCDQNETHDNDTNETGDNETTVLDFAVGGGWFMVNDSKNISVKDTFGMSIDGRAGHFNKSSLVFQARDMGLTVHATEFRTVAFDPFVSEGNHTAHVTGTAVGGGMNWTFRLQITDTGKGMMDLFMLSVTNGSTTVTWRTTGLGGGNITIEPLAEGMEEAGVQD